MLTKFRRLLVTLAAIALPSFFTSASSASVFSSISYAHGAGVQNGNDGLGAGGVGGTTLPVSKTVSASNGPTIQATYTFSDSGNFASLEISTIESLNGPNQSTGEATGEYDKFSFAQPVYYHFVFMDTVSAGSSYNAAVLQQDLNGVFNLGQIQNSSYESDGTLVAGLSYVLSEEFDLGNSPTGHPNAGSATSDFLLTFTAVPEPSLLGGLCALAAAATFRRRARLV